MLKKNSYAANVLRIVNFAMEHKNEWNPNYLILGTSVAYQGLSLEILNEKLMPLTKKVQSIAIPGAELITQNLAFLKVSKELDNLEVLVHVYEVSAPWVNRQDLTLPTLAMISEFNPSLSLEKVFEYEYDYRYDDIGYILLKTVAYRRDIRNLILNPEKRLKDFFKTFKKAPDLKFEYTNAYEQKMSSYNISDLKDCERKTSPSNLDPIPVDSDSYHKQAVFDTCALALNTEIIETNNKDTKSYFHRLELFYQEVTNSKKIKIIGVFAPYSNLIKNWGGDKRIEIWEQELRKFKLNSPVQIINLEKILDGENNSDYFYDLIHLNRIGMKKFSNHLGDELLKSNQN